MATTFKCVVTKRQKNDGTYPVRLRMIHNRQKKEFLTITYLSSNQITQTGKIKDARIIELLEDTEREYRRLSMEIPGLEYMTADEVVSALQSKKEANKVFSLDFFEFAESRIKKMVPKTAETYRTAVNALRRFVGKETLDINEITSNFIAKFTDFMENEPAVSTKWQTYKKKEKGCRAISLYLSNIRALHNAAREQYNDEDTGYIPIPRQPFRKRGTVPPQPKTENRCLTAEQIRQIFNAEPKDHTEEMAKDVFMMSFFLCGMNTIDFFTLEADGIDNDTITYNRHKTAQRRADHAKITLKIEPELRPLLEKYHAVNDTLYFVFARQYTDPHNFNATVNKGLKRILQMPDVTSYYARHSWATIATNECGVPFDIVHQALVHSRSKEDKVTEIYIKKDFTPIWEANRKVIDFVFGK